MRRFAAVGEGCEGTIIPTKRKRRSISDATPDSVIEAKPRSFGERQDRPLRLPAETPIAKIRLDLPEYVDRQLKLKCVMEGGAKAYYVLRALAKDGFQIKDRDLKLDRRRRKKRQ
jgi:hypothetical protein